MQTSSDVIFISVWFYGSLLALLSNTLIGSYGIYLNDEISATYLEDGWWQPGEILVDIVHFMHNMVKTFIWHLMLFNKLSLN